MWMVEVAVVLVGVVGFFYGLVRLCQGAADGAGNVRPRITREQLPPRFAVTAYEMLLNGLQALRDLVTPPEMKVVEMVHAHWQTQALYAVTRLGVPEAIPLHLPSGQEGWPTVEAVAERVGAKNVDVLYRTLRLLASAGVFREFSGRRFSHTPVSALLRADHPATTSLTTTDGADFITKSLQGVPAYDRWELAFSHMHGGKDLWEHYNQEENREELTDFQKMFDEITRTMTGPLVWDFSWKRVAREIGRSADLIVADVGGGLGGVLAMVLGELPEAKGVLYDQPTVIERAREAERWTVGPLKDRITFEAGSFLEKVPEADIYVMRMILHDWPDDICVNILTNIRKAMRPNGRVIVVDSLLAPEGQYTHQVPVRVELQDLHMAVMLNGKERSEAQFRDLLEAAGFEMTGVTYTRGIFHMVEGKVA